MQLSTGALGLGLPFFSRTGSPKCPDTVSFIAEYTEGTGDAALGHAQLSGNAEVHGKRHEFFLLFFFGERVRASQDKTKTPDS